MKSSHKVHQRKTSPAHYFAVSCFVSLLAWAGSSAQAANVTKLDTTTMVNGAADWSAAPATTDVGEFGGTPQAATLANMTLGGPLTIGGLQFDSTMNGPLTITDANSLTLGSVGLTNGPGATYGETLNVPVALGASQTWFANPGQTLTVGGQVTGLYTLSVAGGGTVSLSNNSTATNSYEAAYVNTNTLLTFNSFRFPAAGAGYRFTVNNGMAVGGSIQATNGSDGTFIAITNGGSLTATNVTLWRSYNSDTSQPTDASPYAGLTTEGFYVNGPGNTTVTLTNLGIGAFGANASSVGRQDGGTVTVSGTMSLADTTGGAHYSVYQVNGGTFSVGDTNTGITIARNASSSRTWAELYLSGGTTTLGTITFGTSADIAGSTSSYGWVLVKGATLYVGNGGVTNASAAANASTSPYSVNFHLYSGLLGAQAPWAGWVPLGLTGPATTPFTIQTADAAGNPHNITLGSGLYGTGALNLTGGGILTLGSTAGSNFTGPVVIAAGTLALSNNASFNPTNIAIIPGAVFDTTVAGGFTLAAGSTLTGGHTNSPAVTDINGNLTSSGIVNIAGTGTNGTLTVNGNLDFTGGTNLFDLSATYNGANDKVVVTGGGNVLTCGGASIAINSAGTLDSTHDYVLFTAPGVSGTFNSVPLWMGTIPPNYANFSVTNIGATVVLHFTAGAVSASSVTASPSSVVRNQQTAFSVTGLPGSGASAMSSITINLGSVGGSSAQALVDTGNHLTFTNSIILPAGDAAFGAVSLPITLVDNNNNVGYTNVVLTILAPATETWNGNDSANNYNWSDNLNWANVNGAYAPGLSGDQLIFTGGKNAPVLDQNYSVSGLTFDNAASAFTLTAAGSAALTLTGGVTNNSASVQTLNLPVTLSGVVTLNVGAAGLAVPGVISGTGSLTKTGPAIFTASTANTFTGGVNLNGGVVNLNAPETAGTSGPLGETGPIAFGGGTLQYSANDPADYSSRFSTAPNNAYSVDLAGQTVTFASGLDSTNGSLAVFDSGTLSEGATLTLSGSSSFAGNMVVSNVTLLDTVNENADAVHAASGLGNLSGTGRTVTINNGGTVEFDAAGCLGGGSENPNLTFIINPGGLLTSSSSYHNNVVGSIILNGGTLTAGSVSTYAYFPSIELGGSVTVGGSSPSMMNQNGGGTGAGYSLGINSIGASGAILSTNFIFNVGLTGGGPGIPDLTVPAALNDISGNNGVNAYAGSTTLVKTGAGYMQLSGANLYTGNTVVSNGTLEIASGGSVLSTNLIDDGGTLEIDGGATISAASLLVNAGKLVLGNGAAINSATNIILASGAELDTTALGAGGEILADNQTLTAGNTGSLAVTNINGDLTVGGILGIAGTGVAGKLTQNGNLFFNTGGTVVFDLSASVSGANDQVVLTGGGGLTGGGVSIAINSGGTLDTHDYVLFNVTGGGSVAGNFYPEPVWLGTTPANANHYYLETVGATVVLHYISGTPPTASSATVNPSTLVRGHYVAFNVTAVPGAGGSSISSVTMNLTAIGGSSSQVLTNTGGSTFGATIFVGPASSAGNLSLPVFITDNNNTLGATNILLTVNATMETWSGNDSANNYNWSDNANWVSGLAPGYVGDSLVFTGTHDNPVMDNNYSVVGLIFNSGASAFTLASPAGTLTVTGAVTNNSANLQTLNLPVAFGAPVMVNAGAGGLSIPGNISGSGGLIEVGTGTNLLGGQNTFAGGVTLNGGVVNLATGENPGSSGPLGTNGPILFGGGILQYSGANQNDYSGRFSTNANQAYNIDTAGQTITFASALTSSGGSLTETGGGTLTLSTANSSFSGSVTVNNGTLVASAGAANTPTTTGLGAPSGGRTITVNSNGVLTLSVNNIFGNTPAVNIPKIVVNGGTFNTVLFNSLGLTGSGTSGVTLQNGAILDVTGVSPAPYFGGNFGDLVTVNGTSGSSITGAGQMDLWNGTSTGVGTGGSTTFNVASTGAGPDLAVAVPLGDTGYSGTATKAGLIKTGAGILQLDAANTYTGGTVVSNGMVNGIGSLASSVLVTPTGNLGAGDVGTSVGTLTLSSNLTLQGKVTLRISKTGGSAQQPDQIDVGQNITYGGTLVVANITADGSPMVLGDTFQLFSVSGTGTGNFAGISGTPGGSLAYGFNPASGVLSVVAATAPVAGFSGSPTNLFANQSVIFVDASSGTGTNWIWRFGDGASVTNSSNASVSHTYASVGAYTVSLTVTGPAGSNTKTLAGYVVVKPAPVLGSTTLVGNSLVMSGTNGPANSQYRILATTNLALSIANWIPVYTNTFGANGSYSYTTPPVTNHASYFLLVSP